MWLPAVLGEITSRSRDLLVRQAAREQPQHLDLARGQPRRPFAAARHAVAGGAEHRLDRVGVEAAGPHLGAQLGGRRLGGRALRAVRTRLAHRLVGVGRAEDPRRARDRRARRGRAGSPSRRGARGAARRSRRAARAPADWCSMRSVRYGCIRTRSHSPAPSGPRLSQIAFETPSRPRSCTRPARRSVQHVVLGQSELPRRPAAARSATARAWPSVYGDFRSTKLAIATQRRVEALAPRARPRAPARPRSPRPRCRPSRGPRGSCPPPRTGSSASAGSNCFPLRSRASAFAASTPPTRCATSTNSASCAIRAAIGTCVALQLARPAAPVPLLVGGAERLAAPPSAARAARRASRAMRGVLGDHAVHVAVAGERELEADAEAVQRRVARRRAAASRGRRRAGCGARGRTCRTSARCRRRTTSPARARRSGSRR